MKPSDGGTLLANKRRWETIIISLCRKNDPDRAPKFKKVCAAYNASCFISDLDDSEEGYFKDISTEEIKKRVRSFVGGAHFDCVFTHGKNGEYGHIRHKQVHRAIVEMMRKNELSTEKITFFDYRKRACSASRTRAQISL